MSAAFLIPGFSLDRSFTDSSLDVLKHEMAALGVSLYGVTDNWAEHGVHSFGRRAVEQSKVVKYDGVLIGHSLGALAALSAVDTMPVRHLVLCSPSALFQEDILANLNPATMQRIGEQRVQELSRFSAVEAVSAVNRLRIPTTVMYGENERELHPQLVARCGQLAAGIAGAVLVEVDDASHSIGVNPYAYELARIVDSIAAELTL